MVTNNRQINRDLAHAIQHIENGNLEMATNILLAAIERERTAYRKKDRGWVMKLDMKMLVGAIAAGIVGAVIFLGDNLPIPDVITAGATALIAWLAAWLNGRNNTA